MREIPVVEGRYREHAREIEPYRHDHRNPANPYPQNTQTSQMKKEEWDHPTKVESILIRILKMLGLVVSIDETPDKSGELSDYIHGRQKRLEDTIVRDGRAKGPNWPIICVYEQNPATGMNSTDPGRRREPLPTR